MAFALTKYIFPIEKVVLSESLGYVLDNPRSEKEIKIIRNFIEKTFIEKNKINGLLAPISIRLRFSLEDLKEKFLDEERSNYVSNYFERNKKKSLIDILCGMWIIVRYGNEDDGFETFEDDREKVFQMLFSRPDSDFVNNFNDLSYYCHILSLLANDFEDEYNGDTFLLSNSFYDLFMSSVNANISETIELFLSNNFLLKTGNYIKTWLYWLDGQEYLKSCVRRLDSLIVQGFIAEKGKKLRPSQQQSPKEKLLHIGKRLKTSYEHNKDPELVLLLLVGNIEYLLTRNPDTNKFNVEDSIGKQFRLKCGIIIHKQNEGIDLVQLNDELREIYDQRSDLAHGNYNKDFNLDKIIKSVYSLYSFNKYMINEYIEDRVLIEYLKDN
ncbi:hypothetical protein [Butyricimonas paravirosa]|uniref:hypothetical protein n=1 Tax=Butyricimonas paravirosa TaxID=1472417 RepID=UPI00242EC3A2|nr:hypothetical protein [Butyricimonas paravirosa]